MSNIDTNTNTGDVFFQLENLNLQIEKIQKHLLVFKKDFASKISLYRLVAKKKKYIKYLEKNNKERHAEFMAKYGAKKKVKLSNV